MPIWFIFFYLGSTLEAIRFGKIRSRFSSSARGRATELQIDAALNDDLASILAIGRLSISNIAQYGSEYAKSRRRVARAPARATRHVPCGARPESSPTTTMIIPEPNHSVPSRTARAQRLHRRTSNPFISLMISSQHRSRPAPRLAPSDRPPTAPAPRN